MGKVDGLSRRPDWKVRVDKDNENQVVVKNSWVHRLKKVIIEGPEVEVIEKIKKARSKDEEVVRIVEEMKKAKVKELQEEEWQIKGDLVLKEGKIYVSKNKELRVDIIWLHHDVLVAGHKRRWKTVELVTRNYWWPGVTRDIGRYMEGCDLYQQMKNRTEEVAGKLKLGEVPEKPWMHISVDFITKLLIVTEKDAILVVCDRLSKMTYFIATTEGMSAERLAILFRDNMWRLHRLPESVVLDRGPHFTIDCHKLHSACISTTSGLIFTK